MPTEPLADLWTLASRQHQAFGVAQAIRLGVPRSTIESLARTGQSRRLHRGVYATPGSVDTALRRCSAALLAVRGDAVVSHRSAAVLLDLVEGAMGPVHLLRPSGSTRRRPHTGVVVHHTSQWDDTITRRHEDLPVTSPARTLRDLAFTFDARQLTHAMAAAVRRGLVDLDELQQLAVPSCGVTGIATYRGALATLLRDGRTDSPFEGDVRHVVHGAGFRPAPGPHGIELEGRVVGWVDIAFIEQRVGLECDSRAWHSDPLQFERDRVKHNDALRADWRILRITYRRFHNDPWSVVRDLEALGVPRLA